MAVNRDRKMVEERATDLDLEYRTLAQARDTILGLIESYGPDATIDKCQADYSDHEYLTVMIQRPETDAEMADRIAYEERRDKQNKESDRATFERLKKVFGE